ncbi:MAG: ABC transporter permease [Tannerellaceae bacterium]|nr:ABC transporter permease [Tannerellaceae bacterium]
MNFSFYIARRYLFSKKSHHAINIISMVSVCGVVIATIALVAVLSVFNGFNDLVSTLFSSLDPELKITPQTGKVFDPASAEIRKLKELPQIACVSEVLQDNAVIQYNGRQVIGVIKGVDDNYRQQASIDSILVDGNFILHEDVVDYATLGIGLAYTLGINAIYSSPLELYAPKRDEQYINLSNPATSANIEYVYIAAIFRMNQQLYDDGYMIVPISLARSLFSYEDEVSALEIKLKDGSKTDQVKKRISSLLGDNYKVQDRYEQQEASFKMMQVEKWMTYLILAFVLMLALFNVVGSLSMLMIEKQEDVRVLRNLGADDPLIRRIFLFEGWMISGFGALIGIAIGLILCWLQTTFGLIKMGMPDGSFIIDTYPVRVVFSDIVAVLATVLTIGFLSAWYPVYRLGERWLKG